MVNDANPRRFVEMLIRMLQESQGAAPTRDSANDPESLFIPWVHCLIKRYYYRKTMQAIGYEMADFIDDCLCRLFEKAKSDPLWLTKPEMNDKVLAVYIITIAKNLRADFGRRKESRIFGIRKPCGSGDNWDGDFDEEIADEAYELPDCDIELIFKFERARFFMSKFVDSLRHEPKELELLNAMLYFYAHDEILNLAVPRYWIVYQLLLPKGRHLPEELRDYLKQSFPDEDFNVISQRKTILRKKLKQFLNDNPYLKEIG